MARLGELHRGVGERAAAVGAFELRNALQQIAKLRVGIARMRGARRVPQRIAFLRELAEIGGNQLVLRGEVAIERHLVGAGGIRQRLDAHAVDAIAIEKLARRAQNALAGGRLQGTTFQTRHTSPRA